MGVILNECFSNSLYKMVPWTLAVELFSCECPRYWCEVNIESGMGLVQSGNKLLHEPNLWHRVASLGHSQLKWKRAYNHTMFLVILKLFKSLVLWFYWRSFNWNYYRSTLPLSQVTETHLGIAGVFIYGWPIFKWVAETWLWDMAQHDDVIK